MKEFSLLVGQKPGVLWQFLPWQNVSLVLASLDSTLQNKLLYTSQFRAEEVFFWSKIQDGRQFFGFSWMTQKLFTFLETYKKQKFHRAILHKHMNFEENQLKNKKVTED